MNFLEVWDSLPTEAKQALRPKLVSFANDAEFYAVRNDVATALYSKPPVKPRRRKTDKPVHVEAFTPAPFTAKSWLESRQAR